jgi:hypothetical protein
MFAWRLYPSFPYKIHYRSPPIFNGFSDDWLWVCHYYCSYPALSLQLIVSSSLMLRFRRAPENVGLLVLAQGELHIYICTS